MKVYDKSELTKNKLSDEAEEKKKKKKNIDLSKLTKGRKRKSNVLKLIVAGIFIIAFAYVWTNAETIFEPLRGIASKIETKTSFDVGFPINLPGSTGYSFRRFGDCFSLLTDTYLYTYETTGGQIYALKHGYSNPEQVTTDKRILLFDKSAYNFALYSKTSRMYEKNLEEKIVYATLGGSNMAAVVTESSRYSNVLYIYDDGGNWKYTKKFADENVMGISFLNSDQIIVSTISVDSGELVLNFYKYSIKDTEGYIWKYSYKGNSLPCGLYADNEKVICVCDNIVLSINSETGEYSGSYSYTGTLKHFALGGGTTIIHYNETSTNKNMVVSLGPDAQARSVTTVSASVEKILVIDDLVYILEGAHIREYDRTLTLMNEHQLENSDCTDFVIIGNYVYLLGYDTIDSRFIM